MLVLAFAISTGLGFAQGAQAKIDTVRAMLAALDVPGPYRLQEFHSPEGGQKFGASVSLTDRDLDRYTAWFRPDAERPYLIFQGEQGGPGFQAGSAPLLDKRISAQVLAWVRRLAGKEQVRLDRMIGDPERVGRASFSITKNGYPFVANFQHYGYEVYFSMPDVKLLYLMATNDVPPVELRKPVLKEMDAVRAFERIFEMDLVPLSVAQHRGKISYRLLPGRTLGYYLPEGAGVAKLVWRIPYMGIRDPSHTRGGGPGAVLVDAVTGRRVSTPFPP